MFSTLFIGSTLGIISLILVAIILKRIVQALPFLKKRHRENNPPLPKKLKLSPHLADFDKAMQNENFDSCRKALIKSINTKVTTNARQIDSLKAEYQQVLARTLVLADSTGLSATEVVPLEEAMTERITLLRKNASLGKRFSKQKSMPNWGKKHFKKQKSELKKSLEKNSTTFTTEIKIFTEKTALAQSEKRKTVLH